MAGNDIRTIRVEDRMRRAWAQLLRELDADGIALPMGADVRIRETEGTLTADATLIEHLTPDPPDYDEPDAPPPRVKTGK